MHAPGGDRTVGRRVDRVGSCPLRGRQRAGADRLPARQEAPPARARCIREARRRRDLRSSRSRRVDRPVPDRASSAHRYPRSRLVHDPVTGALTSEAFEDQLRKEHERVDRGGQPGCLAFIAFDELPELTARYGSRARDELLAQVVRLIKQDGRKLDFVGWRRGMVAVLLPSTPTQGCPDSLRSARAQDLPPGVRDRRVRDSSHAGHRFHRDGRRRHPGGVRRPGLGCDEIPVGPARSAPDALGRSDVDEAGEHVDPETLVRADPNAVPDRQPAARRPRHSVRGLRDARLVGCRHHGSVVHRLRDRARRHRRQHPDRVPRRRGDPPNLLRLRTSHRRVRQRSSPPTCRTRPARSSRPSRRSSNRTTRTSR